MPRASSTKNVYFMKPVGLDGPIKIGCSGWPAQRLIDLSVWSPLPIELIGSVPGSLTDETFLHRCFAETHSHHEWFFSSPSLRAAIAVILAAGSVDAIKTTHAPKGSIRRKRRERTSDQRLHFSYATRIRQTEKRLRALGEKSAWHAPKDIEKIIDGWIDYRGRGATPSAAAFARLDEYLANPATHSVVPSWVETAPRLLKLVAQAEEFVA